MPQCEHVSGAGRRCQQISAVLGTPEGLRCLWHDPARKEDADAARARGRHNQQLALAQGEASAYLHESEAMAPPQNAEEVRQWTSWAIWAVTVNKISEKRAHEIGFLADKFMKASDKAQLESEVKELRERVRALSAVKKA